ncbi:MAG: histidine--tRNA ligase [Rhodospirillales bacterium]|nr:histidine--tRNA ligase [Rhodospirillales bacterium]
MTYRPRPVSGFPEHLPEIRMAEQHMLDRIRATFESYGFASIETPSVEELEVLLAKGETDKEIYTIERLQADEAPGGESRLGLHYDLTVPFARYVAQHFNDLVFPFKRYQMQRVWRGERPQAGRFREFTQCDIDVIGIDNLAVTFDAELAAVAIQALEAIGVGGVTLHISNRKIFQGALSSRVNPEQVVPIIRAIDGMPKVGRDQTVRLIQDIVGGLTGNVVANAIVKLADTRATGANELRQLTDEFEVDREEYSEGISELCSVMDHLKFLGINNVVADLSIARGFDYYTGTVYEGRFDDAPAFGSVVAGGRYDDLAGAFINKKLPGVGISIGFSRLFAKLLADKAITATRRSPADLLIVLPSEERREAMLVTAQALRKRGFKVETYHAPQKIGKQISYAEKKGIPFVWFPPFDDGSQHEVKDMASGVQTPAEIATWNP